LANWIKKEVPTICCLQETNLTDSNKHWLRVKAGKFIKAMAPPKQTGVEILISDKVDLKLSLVK
jgi:exonuclease III